MTTLLLGMMLVMGDDVLERRALRLCDAAINACDARCEQGFERTWNMPAFMRCAKECESVKARCVDAVTVGS
jgi:hypothetical protein